MNTRVVRIDHIIEAIDVTFAFGMRQVAVNLRAKRSIESFDDGRLDRVIFAGKGLDTFLVEKTTNGDVFKLSSLVRLKSVITGSREGGPQRSLRLDAGLRTHWHGPRSFREDIDGGEQKLYAVIVIGVRAHIHQISLQLNAGSTDYSGSSSEFANASSVQCVSVSSSQPGFRLFSAMIIKSTREFSVRTERRRMSGISVNGRGSLREAVAHPSRRRTLRHSPIRP